MMDTTRDLQVPSGWEVESAALHPPVHETRVTVPERSGMRGRLDTLKSRGVAKVHDLQSSLMTAKSSMRDGAKSQVAKMQGSMRTNPMKWAGIAAGAGFGLGMIGRIAQVRAKRRNHMPTLVIVEAGC